MQIDMKKIRLIIAVFIFAASSCCAAFGQEFSSDSLNSMLKYLLEEDQKYRTLITEDSDIELILKMIENDTKVQQAAFPLIDYIIANRIDDLEDEAYQACYYIIQHSDGDDQLRYKDFVEYLYGQGKIVELEYIWFVDRLAVRFNKAQKYGGQAVIMSNGDTVLYPIVSNYAEYHKTTDIDFAGSFDNMTYPPITVGPDEFVIFGCVVPDEEMDISDGSVMVSAGSLEPVAANERGYYVIRCKKWEVPEFVTATYGTVTVTNLLDYCEGGDFAYCVLFL